MSTEKGEDKEVWPELVHLEPPIFTEILKIFKLLYERHAALFLWQNQHQMQQLCWGTETEELGSNLLLNFICWNWSLPSPVLQARRPHDFSGHLFQCLSTLTVKTFPITKIFCDPVYMLCLSSHSLALLGRVTLRTFLLNRWGEQ